MSHPLVSVVIATRERPDLLNRAIESILRQTLREMEVVVVDDGSCETTHEAYRRSQTWADPRVAYHFAAEAPKLVRGVCAARNYGLSLAQAPYVVFFDDDDEMPVENHLETAVQFHKRFPRCLYFGDLRMQNDGKVTEEARIRPFDAPIIRRQVQADPPIYNATIEEFSQVFARRYTHLDATVLDAELTREIGGFAESLIFCEDLNFFLRYADAATTVVYRREPVVDFDVTPRPRMFTAPPPVHRALMISMALSKARASIRNPHLHRAASAIEAFVLAGASGRLNSEGNVMAARYLARQSLALRATRNGLRQFIASHFARQRPGISAVPTA